MHFSASYFSLRRFIGLNWFQAFCASRRFLELPEFPTLESDASDKSFVVLPSRATCHLELGKKIGSTEVSEGLRRILGIFSLRKWLECLLAIQ